MGLKKVDTHLKATIVIDVSDIIEVSNKTDIKIDSAFEIEAKKILKTDIANALGVEKSNIFVEKFEASAEEI